MNPIISEDELFENNSDFDAICMHKNDRVCYNDIGNKKTIKRIESENVTDRESLELDSLRSGESFFKTFTFDVKKESDPDMQKCLEFWKSILEKNIKPTKCSFLKRNGQKKTNKEHESQSSISNSSSDSEKMLKMWTEIYKDLQKRKLDQIKLVKKQKCSPCDEYIDEEAEKQQEKEDIKKLNSWKPEKEIKKISKFDLKAEIQRSLRVLLESTTDNMPSATTKEFIKTSRSSVKEKIASTTSDVRKEGKTSELSIKEKILSKTSDVKKEANISESNIKEKNLSKISQVKEEKVITGRSSQGLSIKEKNASTIVPIKQSSSKFHQQMSIENVARRSETVKSSESKQDTSKDTKGEEESTCSACGLKAEECVQGKEDICDMEAKEHAQDPSADVCAPCGLTECVEDLESIIEEASQLALSTCGVPCDCTGVCKCEKHPQEVSCTCQCGVDACVCGEVQKPCPCGCQEDDCICERLDEKEDCICGCGLDECVCTEFLTRSPCKCGHADCDCDLLSILSTYMETLHTPVKTPTSLNRQVQTEEELKAKSLQELQVGGRYCVICGHYGCFCNVQKKRSNF